MSKKSKIKRTFFPRPQGHSIRSSAKKKKKRHFNFELPSSLGDFSSHFYYSLTNIKIEIFDLDCIVC